MFFDPFVASAAGDLAGSDLTDSEAQEIVRESLWEYADCFVNAIMEWDDPVSIHYGNEIVLGLAYERIGIRPEAVSSEDHDKWLEKIIQLEPVCELAAREKLLRAAEISGK